MAQAATNAFQLRKLLDVAGIPATGGVEPAREPSLLD